MGAPMYEVDYVAGARIVFSCRRCHRAAARPPGRPARL